MNTTIRIEFGDNVKFVDSETTRKAGVAEKKGICVGHTVPSLSNIRFIGPKEPDYAIAVKLTETKEIIWTTEDLMEFMNFGEGQTIETGRRKLVRMADGSWYGDDIDPEKEKKSWLKRLFGK